MALKVEQYGTPATLDQTGESFSYDQAGLYMYAGGIALSQGEQTPDSVRQQMLDNYSAFEPAVNNLLGELEDPDTRHLHAKYLGSGSNEQAFSVPIEDRECVIRLNWRDGPGMSKKDTRSHAVASRLEAAVQAKNIRGLEQGVAASLEKGIFVSELMPGNEMSRVPLEHVEAISDEQLTELVDTVEAAHSKNISIDPKPSNIFYDPDKGFGIVDLALNHETGKPEALGVQLGYMANVLGNIGIYKFNPRTRQDYERVEKYSSASLPVIERFRQICKSRYTGAELETTLSGIDKQLTAQQKTINSLRDPIYVETLVSDNIKREEIQQARNESNKNNPTADWTITT